MKSIPKKEKQLLTYCEKGIPKYIVTRVFTSGVYRLYKCDGEEFIFIKTRKNDPLFTEVK